MSADLRKEKVIHTRIPSTLDEQIRRVAEGMRVPVSNLVRNILEDAVGGVRPLPGPGDDPIDAVYGWQSLTLNQLVPCERCRAALAAGTKAYLGLSDRQQRRVFVCGACLPRPVVDGAVSPSKHDSTIKE